MCAKSLHIKSTHSLNSNLYRILNGANHVRFCVQRIRICGQLCPPLLHWTIYLNGNWKFMYEKRTRAWNEQKHVSDTVLCTEKDFIRSLRSSANSAHSIDFR